MTPLAELCVAIVDCEHKTAPKSADGGGFPLIRTTDIGQGRLSFDNVHRVDSETYEKWTRRAIPQPGDLILAREAPVGNVAVVLPNTEPVLGQRTVLIRPNEALVDAYYLTYRLLCSDVQYWMDAVSNGATVPHLNMEDIRSLPVPTLPPLAIQQEVGAVLSALDDLIENNRQRIEILEELSRLLYREWFVKFRFPGHETVRLVSSDIGPIPEAWEVGEFADLVLETRQTVSPEEIPNDAPTVGLEHLPRRSTTLKRWATASSIGSRRKIFEEGDILFAKIRPYFHKVVDAPFSGYASTDAIVFRPKSPSLGPRALAVASSDDFVGVATATSNGTRMPRANTELLMSYGIPHPSPSIEQAFSEAVGPLDTLRKNLAEQSRCLSKAKDLLLPRLMSGALDISDLDLELEAVGV